MGVGYPRNEIMMGLTSSKIHVGGPAVPDPRNKMSTINLFNIAAITFLIVKRLPA